MTLQWSLVVIISSSDWLQWRHNTQVVTLIVSRHAMTVKIDTASVWLPYVADCLIGTARAALNKDEKEARHLTP